MRVRYSILVALGSALILVGAGTAPATTTSYIATLSGLEEVPANPSPATGTAFIVYDDVANTISTTGSFSGLVDILTAGHFHGPAAVGVNAGVIHGFSGLPLGATSGSWSDVWSGLTSTQVGYLTSGLLYVNLHSHTYPGGEIRGQVKPEATPSRAL